MVASDERTPDSLPGWKLSEWVPASPPHAARAGWLEYLRCLRESGCFDDDIESVESRRGKLMRERILRALKARL